MKSRKIGGLLIYLFVIVLSSAVWVTATAAAESRELDEAAVQVYLEKKVAADPGSCLVKAIRLHDGNWIDRETVAIISK